MKIFNYLLKKEYFPFIIILLFSTGCKTKSNDTLESLDTYKIQKLEISQQNQDNSTTWSLKSPEANYFSNNQIIKSKTYAAEEAIFFQ